MFVTMYAHWVKQIFFHSRSNMPHKTNRKFVDKTIIKDLARLSRIFCGTGLTNACPARHFNKPSQQRRNGKQRANAKARKACGLSTALYQMRTSITARCLHSLFHIPLRLSMYLHILILTSFISSAALRLFYSRKMKCTCHVARSDVQW